MNPGGQVKVGVRVAVAVWLAVSVLVFVFVLEAVGVAEARVGIPTVSETSGVSVAVAEIVKLGVCGVENDVPVCVGEEGGSVFVEEGGEVGEAVRVSVGEPGCVVAEGVAVAEFCGGGVGGIVAEPGAGVPVRVGVEVKVDLLPPVVVHAATKAAAAHAAAIAATPPIQAPRSECMARAVYRAATPIGRSDHPS